MKQKASFKSMRRAACACMAALAALTSLAGCGTSNDPTPRAEADAGKARTEALFTEPPRNEKRTEEIEAPSEASADKKPEQTQEAGSGSFAPILRSISGRDDLLILSQRLLEGKRLYNIPTAHYTGAVYFRVEADGLVAYNRRIYPGPEELYDPFGNLAYDLVEPIATYPRELGIEAKKSLVDFYKSSYDPNYPSDEPEGFEGYTGDNYIIFTNEVFHGIQASVIFVTSDGWKTWKEVEVPTIGGFPKHVTGGCMLSDKEGFLCFYEKATLGDEYKLDELSVYKTADAGERWHPLKLRIPLDEVGVLCDPITALSPMFDGDHGIMLVQYGQYVKEFDEWESYIGWFETFDRGESWEFHPDPVSKLFE